MVNDDTKMREMELSDEQFLSELYRRTSLLPFKSESGNEFISINTKDCANGFLQKVEILAGSKNFKLLIRGTDYYLEVLEGKTFFDNQDKKPVPK